MTPKELVNKHGKTYQWILDADTENADVYVITNTLIWKKGTWKNGFWKNGIWGDGIWKHGTWKHGIWKYGTWKDGLWENGIWENGHWLNGIWENGTWKSGFWKKGTWKNGTWKKLTTDELKNKMDTIKIKLKKIGTKFSNQLLDKYDNGYIGGLSKEDIIVLNKGTPNDAKRIS